MLLRFETRARQRRLILRINARPSYSHLKIENLGAVRHLEFQGRWISTIVGPSDTSNEPTYQI